jgi:hypothetical protein
MAGGIFFIVTIAAFLTARLVLERGKEWKRRLAGIAILSAIALFGIWITPLPSSVDYLQATSVAGFFSALTGILSWPCGVHWACVIIQAPFIALVLITLFRRVPSSDIRWFPIITGTSIWLLALITAYKRGVKWDADRYFDLWAVLLLTIFSCLCMLPAATRDRLRFIRPMIAVLWIPACFFGVLYRSAAVLPQKLLDRWTLMMDLENDVREYLKTGDQAWLPDIPGLRDPSRSEDVTREDLDSKALRNAFPSNLYNPTPPLAPFNQKMGPGEFVPNGYPNTMALLDKPTLGSFGAKADHDKKVVTLMFRKPVGAREVILQVAGYPNRLGKSIIITEPHRPPRSINTSFDPGEHWQTVYINLSPKSKSFKITAKDEWNTDWFAFSMPVVSTDSFPSRLARALASVGIYILLAGFGLLTLGILNSAVAAPET